MYICVDFDGTMVDHCFPGIGEPAPNSVRVCKRLIECGHLLILWTMRSDGQESGDVLSEAVEWMNSYGIGLHGINCNPDQASWTESPKAYGHIYVDDAAIGCPLIKPKGFHRPCVDWSAVEKIIFPTD